MKRFKVECSCMWFIVAVSLFAIIDAALWPDGVYAQAVSITISAQNKSDQDTPFCGKGGGHVGDKLTASVFTDLNGVTTGKATFKSATGAVTTLNIDHVSSFCCGILLGDSSTGNVIPIWLDDNQAPVHVNVEMPGGCTNTVSTFTSGVDRVSVVIRVK
jgi:hypothetical protein